jgi:hypothetical protein
MYTETRSRDDNPYRAEAISITYSEFVFVALGIQHAMRIRHIVICDLPRSTIFFHIISKKRQIFGKNLFIIKCVFLFSLQIFSEKI